MDLEIHNNCQSFNIRMGVSSIILQTNVIIIIESHMQ